jgi:hypothetical protein
MQLKVVMFLPLHFLFKLFFTMLQNDLLLGEGGGITTNIDTENQYLIYHK